MSPAPATGSGLLAAIAEMLSITLSTEWTYPSFFDDALAPMREGRE
jgi:hypothetical protein